MPHKGGEKMINEVVLVGRLTKDPEVMDTENGKKRASIILAVPRKFKNVDGIYETDFIRVILWNVIAINTKEYCKSGDLLGVKGRIQINSYKDSEDNTHYVTDIIAEKITFLSSKRNESEESLENEGLEES